MRLTVGQIAEQIQRPGEDLPALTARLVNLTKEGLLRPVGGKHTGRGHRRYYDSAVVIDALVLNALSDLGIPAVQIAAMSGKLAGEEKTMPLLRLARRAAEQFEEHERAGEWCWLSINRDRSRMDLGPTAILYITKNIYDPPESRKVQDLVRSFEDVCIPNWSQASLVLNLTLLFRQLRNPAMKGKPL